MSLNQNILVQESTRLSDLHSCLVTPKTLNHIKLLNYSWVSVTLASKVTTAVLKPIVNKHFIQHEKEKTGFILHLLIDKDQFNMGLCNDEPQQDNQMFLNREMVNKLKNDVFYVSSLALFKICHNDVKLYNHYKCTPCYLQYTCVNNFSDKMKSNYAKSISLSCITCPSEKYYSRNNLDKIITDYFSVTKVCQVKDLISIVTSGNQRELLPTKLYFRVETLDLHDVNSQCDASRNTNAMFVDAERTTLCLLTAGNAHIPQCTCVHNNNFAMIDYLQCQPFLSLFDSYYPKIERLIALQLINQVNLIEVLILLKVSNGTGESLMMRSICLKYCLHFYEFNCFDLIGDSLSATEKRIIKVLNEFEKMTPCILHLKNIHLLNLDKDGINEERRLTSFFVDQIKGLKRSQPSLIICSTDCIIDVTARFHSDFYYHITIEAPNHQERESIIQSVLTNTNDQSELITDLVKKTAGFMFSDLVALFCNIHKKDKFNTSIKLHEHLDEIIEQFKALKSVDSAKTVTVPKVEWADVGGLQLVKTDILDTIDLPLKHPHLFTGELKRSGLLLYGAPGCGKTLLAKAIATEFTLNFYSVKGPELINMYVGQSEENIREVFRKARSMTPCVVFFDELDSLAPNRGHSGDSGGVMDRIVSQLLAELDGIHDNTDIFIIGATNRPDLIDPALLRPGRFDKMIYVGLPDAASERLKIFKAVCRKLTLDKDVFLSELEAICPKNMSGADFSALASDALLNCYRRLIHAHEKSNSTLDECHVVICKEDFMSAICVFKPSISETELRRYKLIRKGILNKT